VSSGCHNTPLQPFVSQLSSWPFPLLPSLLSKLHAQPDITLLLLLVEAGAAAAACTSATFLAAVFQESQHHFVNY